MSDADERALERRYLAGHLDALPAYERARARRAAPSLAMVRHCAGCDGRGWLLRGRVDLGLIRRQRCPDCNPVRGWGGVEEGRLLYFTDDGTLTVDSPRLNVIGGRGEWVASEEVIRIWLGAAGMPASRIQS